MSAKVEIDTERCKGCGLCVEACPRGCLVMGKEFNSQGYAFAVFEPGAKGCSGCGMCMEMCPDMAITVIRPRRKRSA